MEKNMLEFHTSINLVDHSIIYFDVNMIFQYFFWRVASVKKKHENKY